MVQADLLVELPSRVVAPLVSLTTAPRLITRLNPVIDVAGVRYTVLMQALTSVPRSRLRLFVATTPEQRDAIALSLDVLLVGF